jgi:glyoxylase-like metal-dependent hydrolase (beta-lactamase superfamily II)
VWGLPEPVAEAQEFTDSLLAIEDLTFEVVDLSGHCEEMVGFWEPNQKWFFSSDAVPLPSRKQMAMPEENIPMMIQRMHEIQAKKPEVLFDGHHGPIINPQEHIATRIRFLTDLQNQVLELIAEGTTISEIKSGLGFPEPWYLPNTEGRFGVEHLIRSLAEDQVC